MVLIDGSRHSSSYKFTYRLDPTFLNIEPRSHLFMYAYLMVLSWNYMLSHVQNSLCRQNTNVQVKYRCLIDAKAVRKLNFC